MRCLTFEVTGARRQDALARLAKMYRVPPSGPRWPAVARPVDQGVRPRRSRSVEDLRALEVVPNRKTPDCTTAGTEQRVECLAERDGGKRGGREAGQGDADSELHKAPHFIQLLGCEA